MSLQNIRERELAELFHDTYETLAPAYGYETRPDTKAFDPESKNGKLMIATCKFILENHINPEFSKLIEGLKEKLVALKKLPTEDQEDGLEFDEGYDDGLDTALAILTKITSDKK